MPDRKSPEEVLRAVLVCPDQGLSKTFQDAVRAAGAADIVRILDSYPDPTEFGRALLAHAPEVVFVSIESLGDALALAREVDRILPGAQTVAVGIVCESAVLLECMRAGIREFATAPFDRQTLLESSARVRNELKTRPVTNPFTNRVFSFLPAKGGSGATTVALNAAAAMALQLETRVALIDFDFAGGMLRFLLKLDNAYSTADALERVPNLDENLWPQLITQVNRLDVMHAGPVNPEMRFDVGHLHTLIEFARRHYSALCFDAPGRLDTRTVEILAESRNIVLVCTPEAPVLHMAREKLDYLQRHDLLNRVIVVLNRCARRGPLTSADIERVLGKPVSAVLANDYQAVQKSIADAAFLKPDSELGKGIQMLAGRLLEQKIAAPVEPKRTLIKYFSVRPSRYTAAPDAKSSQPSFG